MYQSCLVMDPTVFCRCLHESQSREKRQFRIQYSQRCLGKTIAKELCKTRVTTAALSISRRVTASIGQRRIIKLCAKEPLLAYELQTTICDLAFFLFLVHKGQKRTIFRRILGRKHARCLPGWSYGKTLQSTIRC